jgi:hypothetical protein
MERRHAADRLREGDSRRSRDKPVVICAFSFDLVELALVPYCKRS